MDAIYARRRPLALVAALLALVSAILVLAGGAAGSERSATFHLVTTGTGLAVALVLAGAPRLGPNAAWLLPFVGGLLVAAGAGPTVVGTTASKVVAGLAVLILMVFAVVALVHKVDAAGERPVSRL